jgi:protein-disulfide isomerase
MARYESAKGRRSKEQQRKRLIWIIVIVIGALLVAAALILPSLNKPKIQTRARPMANANTMGDSNAKIMVEEFSDFQCPYCKKFAEEMEPAFTEKYIATGKVFFTYTPYSFIGPESVRASEAALCAADQNKFWEMHDILFGNQAGENTGVYTDNNLKSYARDAGLDMTAFNDCFASGKYTKQVNDNVTYGTSKGVRGTPYFLVGDKLVDATQLEATVDQALSAAK